jgi:hypothetical protein
MTTFESIVVVFLALQTFFAFGIWYALASGLPVGLDKSASALERISEDSITKQKFEELIQAVRGTR